MVFTHPTQYTHLSVPYLPSHPLNVLDLHLPSPPSPSRPWILYIHGGAWRDPAITRSTAHPFLNALTSLRPSLTAATLSYRLSPHPSYPHLRNVNNAKHPEHLEDILSAVSFLEKTYGLRREDAILVGHSAGGTLALQVLSRLLGEKEGEGGKGPRTVVGVEGIYNLNSLVEEYPDYEEFVSGAFGEDKRVWEEASPGCMSYGGYAGRVVLVQSEEDELLSSRQTEEFVGVLEAQGAWVDVRRVRGRHNEVPTGKELVEIVSGLVDK